MKKFLFSKSVPKVVTIVLNAALFIAIIFLMNHVQALLYSDAEINLTEVVTQNKDVITSKLMLEVNNLDLVANRIAEKLKNEETIERDTIQRAFLTVAQGNPYYEDIYVAGLDGKVSFRDKDSIDISGCRYFKRACEGK